MLSEVNIHTIPTEVGVHAGLPINEVFGLERNIKDRDLNPHALMRPSEVVLTPTIGLITLVMMAMVGVMTMRWTRVVTERFRMVVENTQCLVKTKSKLTKLKINSRN